MTDRMTALDAFFFYTEEDGRNHMHVGGFALVEGAAPTAEEIATMLRPKMGRIPRYRQLARPVPLHLGRPLWVDAAHFDVADHVRAVRLPERGHNALRSELESFISVPLDRSRPLWELLVVNGVDPERWAVAWKIHHSMVDGVSGTELLTILFDTHPDAQPGAAVESWQPSRGVSTPRVLAGSAAAFAGGLARTVVNVRPHGREGRAGLEGRLHPDATNHPAGREEPADRPDRS